MRNLKFKLLISLIGLTTLNITHASTSTVPMQVSVTVDAKCNITINNMALGSIKLNASNPNISSSFTAECTNGTAYSISFDAGLNGNASGYRLKHATLNEYLQYMLWVQSSSQQINPNQTVYSGTGIGITGNGTPVVIQGGVNSNANVTPGNFSDIVSVTITY
jgi:outer membrane usher protein